MTDTLRWVEVRCPKCGKTCTVREGTVDGEPFRDQAYCPPSTKHRKMTLMRPYGTAQVAAKGL